MRSSIRSTPLLLAMSLGLHGCGEGASARPDDAAAEAGASADEAPSVTIVEPRDGAVLDGPTVRVVLETRGLMVVPAGDATPGSGHHHLFLNDDVSPDGLPIPFEEGRVVHLGDGSSEYTLQGLEPGEHRLIAIVGDALHVPLVPAVTDTVRFQVR